MWEVLIDKKDYPFFPSNSYDVVHYFLTKLIFFSRSNGLMETC